jgi:hypothetical protein
MPLQRPETDQDKEEVTAAGMLAQKVLDMASAEGQRLFDSGADMNSANGVIINALAIALANVCHFAKADGAEVAETFRSRLRDIKRMVHD